MILFYFSNPITISLACVSRVAGLAMAVTLLLSVVIYLLFVSDACLLGIWCNMTGAKELEEP